MGVDDHRGASCGGPFDSPVLGGTVNVRSSVWSRRIEASGNFLEFVGRATPVGPSAAPSSLPPRFDVRLIAPDQGGGPAYDLGVYCIDAARYLFQDEPIEVFALSANNGERRFKEVDEMTTGIMRFPAERLAIFTTSFGTANLSVYQVMGTKGNLLVDRAYSYTEERKHELTVNGKTERLSFPKRDQFAAELLYFSDCVLHNREPEPGAVTTDT